MIFERKQTSIKEEHSFYVYLFIYFFNFLLFKAFYLA